MEADTRTTPTKLIGVQPLQPGMDLADNKDMHSLFLAGAGDLFGLFDAAAHPDLIERLTGSGLDHCCLYNADDDPDLRLVAPWLVRLPLDSVFLRNMVTKSDKPWHGWANGAGLFLRSECSLADLRTHFRRLVMIRSERDSKLFLRFWMPDIFQALLHHGRTEWPGPLRFFGTGRDRDVSAYFIPDTKSNQIAMVAAPPALPEGQLVADAEFHRIMRGVMRRRFTHEVTAHCLERFPARLSHLSEHTAHKHIDLCVDQAERHGLSQRGPVYVWSEACMIWGASFANDPLFAPHVAQAFANAGTQMDVARQLHAALAAYVDGVLGPRNAGLNAALARIETAIDAPRDIGFSDLMRHVWPEKVLFAGQAGEAGFLHWVGNGANHMQSVDPAARRCHGLLSLVLGVGFATDPVYRDFHKITRASANQGFTIEMMRVARECINARLATQQVP